MRTIRLTPGDDGFEPIHSVPARDAGHAHDRNAAAAVTLAPKARPAEALPSTRRMNNSSSG